MIRKIYIHIKLIEYNKKKIIMQGYVYSKYYLKIKIFYF
jgi:hypothetical protein